MAAPNQKNPTSHAIVEIGRSFLADFAGEGLVRSIPASWVEITHRNMPDSLLTDSDARKDWGRALAAGFALLGVKAEHCLAVATFFEQATEEVGKQKNKLDGKGGARDRKIIREAFESKKSLLDPLREKEQGDKVQKRALPDYFTAKAAIKDQSIQDILTAIESALPADKIDAFLNKGGYRIQTTPEELISIAKASKEEDGHAYGVLRLLGLMNGQRGEGGIKAKVQSALDDVIDEVMTGGDIGKNLETLASKAESWAKESKDKRDKRKAV